MASLGSPPGHGQSNPPGDGIPDLNRTSSARLRADAPHRTSTHPAPALSPKFSNKILGCSAKARILFGSFYVVSQAGQDRMESLRALPRWFLHWRRLWTTDR